MNLKEKKEIVKSRPHSVVRIDPKEIFLSFHSKQRFAERHIGIPEAKSKEYVRRNDQQIYEAMRLMIQESDILAEGYNELPGTPKQIHIRIYEKLLFIYSANDVLLTIWKTDYHSAGMPIHKVRRTIIHNKIQVDYLHKQRRRLTNQIDSRNFAIQQLRSLNVQSPEINAKISFLLEERNKLRDEADQSIIQERRTKEENRKIMRRVLYNYEF